LSYVLSLPAGDAKANAIGNVVSTVASSDPSAAIAWAQQQTDTNVTAIIWPRLIQQIANDDPQTAAGLLQNLPQGETLNKAILNVSFQLLQSDPASAMQLVSTVTGEGRNVMEQTLASNWMQHDPAAATQWVNNSSLPAQIKQNILQQK